MENTLKNLLKLLKQKHSQTDSKEETKRRILRLINYVPSWKKKKN